MSRIRGHKIGSIVVAVPGSKSLANRALVCAALARGNSSLVNIPESDDVRLMVEALRTLGHSIRQKDGEVAVDPHDASEEVILQCGLAGTTSRFLTALAAARTAPTVIDGAARLRQRPMGELLDALAEIGADISFLGSPRCLPVKISRSPEAMASAKHTLALRGDVSSQFISALMMIGPSIGGISIDVTSELVSRPYVEMTADVMRHFGAAVEVRERSVEVSSTPLKGCRYVVEPDFSSAAFPIVATLISGGEVRVKDLGLSQAQGDSFILDIARMVGGRVTADGDDIVVHHDGLEPLRPFSVDLADCSDLAPVVTVLALFAQGRSAISGIGFIREKESNRVDGVAEQLRRCGAIIDVSDDGLTVLGGQPLHAANLSVNDDHRLAMSFAVLATRVEGIVIDDPEVVSKSWPGFWSDLADVVSIAE